MLPISTTLVPNSVINNIGTPFIILQSVPSTNSYAIDMVQANLAAHGTAFFTDEQTLGRGQRGKKWLSEKGANIILSVVLDTKLLSLNRQFALSMAVALACYDFFNKYAIDKTTIKWPNDIYWNDRKAAGILIENTIKGSAWTWAVVGIGMNINQTFFSEIAKNAVSLKQITGKSFDVVALAKELCVALNNRFQQLVSGGEKELVAAYQSVLYKKNENVTLRKDNILFNATIEGVNMNGALLVKDAAYDSFVFGEVEWV